MSDESFPKRKDEAIRDHLRSLPWPMEAITPGWYHEHPATFERNRAAILALRRKGTPHNEGALSYNIWPSLVSLSPGKVKPLPRKGAKKRDGIEL